MRDASRSAVADVVDVVLASVRFFAAGIIGIKSFQAGFDALWIVAPDAGHAGVPRRVRGRL
jgi:hypothetical protein